MVDSVVAGHEDGQFSASVSGGKVAAFWTRFIVSGRKGSAVRVKVGLPQIVGSSYTVTPSPDAIVGLPGYYTQTSLVAALHIPVDGH
jgi:hypothetical protein